MAHYIYIYIYIYVCVCVCVCVCVFVCVCVCVCIGFNALFELASAGAYPSNLPKGFQRVDICVISALGSAQIWGKG